MEASFRSFFVLLALFTIRALAQSQCVSYGIDYANGGSYFLDGSSTQYFSFVTVFQGCPEETINPVLVGPDGNQYACSSIRTQPAGTQVTSTCGIPFGAMDSGSWRIVLDGQNVKVQRVMTFTVGVPATTTTTVTPTIVVGVTSTPPMSTLTSTLMQALTLVYPAPTVTNSAENCRRTVTQMPQATTATVRLTETRTATDGQVTSYWATTSTTAAVCHYPTKKRDLAAMQDVTVTVTAQNTVTSYTTTVVPARVTTELKISTTTATVTPPAVTVCEGGGAVGATVTVTSARQTSTVTQVVFQTAHLSGTVWVGSTAFATATNSASATACWRAGGWYGV